MSAVQQLPTVSKPVGSTRSRGVQFEPFLSAPYRYEQLPQPARSVRPARPDQRAPQPTAKLRLTRRGRLVFSTLGLLLGVLTCFMILFQPASARATVDSDTASLQTYSVHAGDNLWSIAQLIAPDYDPRDVIYDLTALNQLEQTTLQPGQLLYLPAKYDLP